MAATVVSTVINKAVVMQWSSEWLNMEAAEVHTLLSAFPLFHYLKKNYCVYECIYKL